MRRNWTTHIQSLPEFAPAVELYREACRLRGQLEGMEHNPCVPKAKKSSVREATIQAERKVDAALRQIERLTGQAEMTVFQAVHGAAVKASRGSREKSRESMKKA